MSASSGYMVPMTTDRLENVIGGSRFIATAGRAETVDDAKTFIHNLRQEMPDATHHVYAFRVGHGASVIEGMSDDGEPSGTSGPPTLAVLRGSGIGDIVVVITRYFGGTKLGTGGLTRAYGDSTKSILGVLSIERKVLYKTLFAQMPYVFFASIERLVPAFEGFIDEREFVDDVRLIIRVPDGKQSAFVAAVVEMTSGIVSPTPFDGDT